MRNVDRMPIAVTVGTSLPRCYNQVGDNVAIAKGVSSIMTSIQAALPIWAAIATLLKNLWLVGRLARRITTQGKRTAAGEPPTVA